MPSISLAQLEKTASLVALFLGIKITPKKLNLDFPVPRGMELVFEMFSSAWTANETPIFANHNRLFSSNSIFKSKGFYEGMPCTPGHIVIAEENQAVWFASTLSDKCDDQSVFINIPGNDPHIIEYPSINSFLAGIILEESMNGASLNRPCSYDWNDAIWDENNYSIVLNNRPHYGFGFTRFLMSDDGKVIIGGDEARPMTASSNFNLPLWLTADLN